MKLKLLLALAFTMGMLYSCKKWKDPDPVTDPRVTARKYCNDPEAVNYNWDFPGTPDNTTCFYPSDLFKGDYLFKDSIYRADNTFDSARSLTTFALHFIALSKNKFAVVGFCGNFDSLKFTAERSTYKASGDSTIHNTDTTFGYGQFFCSTLDTLSGTVAKIRSDSSGKSVLVEFMVVSDTGVNYHRGTAIKQ